MRITGHDQFGSSPRLRGTGRHRQSRGEIPTVHPRACGERGHACALMHSPHGSSPRLRGTAHTDAIPKGLPRFIPAPAGNGANAAREKVLSSVHPRACGERKIEIMNFIVFSGSSPRLRGTADPGAVGSSILRFIPAPAGNGSMPTAPTFTPTVHPRACGERSPRK